MSFDWLPSGAEPDYFRFLIGVRESKDNGNKIRHSSLGESSILHLPHADVLFDIGNIIFEDNHERTREAQGFHQLVKVGPFHYQDSVLKKYGPYFMSSAHNLERGLGRFAKESGVMAFLDSGGAQLKFRRASFVDIDEVIQIYNESADVGTALDLPPRTRLKPKRDVDHCSADLEMLAAVQRKNNAIFVDKRNREDLVFMNVAHGCYGDDFRRYTDTVIDPLNFPGWAVSFDSDRDPLCIWRGVAVLIREYDAAGQWLHLFGVSGATTIPIMGWLGKVVPKLTSDSSSWVQGVKYYKYLNNRNGRLDDVPIGKDFTGKDTDLLEPYCTCEFCQIMKTFGAYRETALSKRPRKDNPDGRTNISYPALASHNLITIKRCVASWNERATQMTLKEYLAEIRRCFPIPTGGQDFGAGIIQTIKYLECALANGPEYADRHAAGKLIGRSFIAFDS